MPKRLHYAWFVCIGCALLLFCTSGLAINAFTIFQPFILKQNGFTNAQTSLIITMRSLFGFLSMLFVRVWYKHLSMRNGMAAAGGILSLSFVLFGLAKRLWQYYLAAAVCGIGYGLGTMIPIAIVLEHWFIERRNTALGICSASTGLSTLGIPNLISHAVETIGLRKTFLYEAAATAVLVLISFLLIRNTPEEKKTEAYGTENTEKKTKGIGPGLKRGDWCILVPAILLVGAMTSSAFSHLTVLTVGEGFSESDAATAVMVAGVAMTVGKIVYGRLGDAISNFRSNRILGAVLLCGMLCCCFVRFGKPMLLAAMALYGFGLSVTTVGMTAWVSDWAAPEQYDRTVQYFQLIYAVGSFVFASLPGIMADRAGGSYTTAYAFFAACTVLVLAAVQFVYRRANKRR